MGVFGCEFPIGFSAEKLFAVDDFVGVFQVLGIVFRVGIESF
jgi:hypothetical protein